MTDLPDIVLLALTLALAVAMAANVHWPGAIMTVAGVLLLLRNKRNG